MGRPGSVGTVSVEDFCAPTPYARIASPNGNNTIPVQRSQNATENAALREMVLLEPI